jgi:hypothetical protein
LAVHILATVILISCLFSIPPLFLAIHVYSVLCTALCLPVLVVFLVLLTAKTLRHCCGGRKRKRERESERTKGATAVVKASFRMFCAELLRRLCDWPCYCFV